MSKHRIGILSTACTFFVCGALCACGGDGGTADERGEAVTAEQWQTAMDFDGFTDFCIRYSETASGDETQTVTLVAAEVADGYYLEYAEENFYVGCYACGGRYYSYTASAIEDIAWAPCSQEQCEELFELFDPGSFFVIAVNTAYIRNTGFEFDESSGSYIRHDDNNDISTVIELVFKNERLIKSKYSIKQTVTDPDGFLSDGDSGYVVAMTVTYDIAGLPIPDGLKSMLSE